MIIYSHRGESKYAPENTLSAFYLADSLNSDGIECDIRKTKDNKLVIIHDKTIDRTSNGYGYVSDYMYDELLKYDFGKGERIVLLSDFLKYFSNKNIKIYIEVKERGYEDLIWNIISKYNLQNIELISFKYDILENLRTQSSILLLGFLVYDITNEIIIKSKKINIKQILCFASAITKKNVQKLKENNLQIVAWGVKNTSELKRLKKMNIDAIIFDSSYEAKRALKDE